jgi:AraC-like DNA-binding protein
MEKKRELRYRKAEVAALVQCRAVIRAEYGSRLTVQGLSIKVGLNRDKLKKGYKLLYGISVHQDVIRIRMEVAAHLLLTTEEPMKSIAGKVGYKPRNFFGVFFRFYGVTPSRMRKK